MRRAGYETCYVGKWHTPGRPSAAGYVRTEGLYAGGRAKRPLTNPTDGQGRPVTGYVGWTFQTDDGQDFPEQGVGLTPQTTTQLGDAAVRYLEAKREAPFFLHVNFTAPHDPLHPLSDKSLAYDPAAMPLPKNFRAEHPFDHGNARGRDELLFAFPRMEAEVRAELALYYANISDVDRQVGRMLQTLDAVGQLENTLVIVTSDHGLAIGSHGLRGKQNMYEHTVGVPLVIRGPEIPRGKQFTAQCYLRDLYPTVCDLTGVPIPETVQSPSLKPVLTGAQTQVHDAVFAHFRDSQRMVRTERWKYIVYPLVDREQLFDIVDDPDELHDRSTDPRQANVLADLRARLTAWRRDNNDSTLAAVRER
jgi:arylsulfatase A-like enzyme